MGVTVDRDPAARSCIVRLDGDVDMALVPYIREQLETIVETGCLNVVLDLADVDYVDSSALGLIVWLDRRLAPCEGRLVLAGANCEVSRILEISGLVGVAPTISSRESVDEAVAALKPASESHDLCWTESIMLPAQAESLAQVRTAVCDLLAAVDLSESGLFDVKVAVGEALANAVRHGSPGGATDQIRVDIGAYDDRVVIQVRDRGSGFDTERAGDDDNLFAAGGRGVLFMRALMDGVDFSTDPSTGGTVVTLEKRLRYRREVG